MFRVYTDTNPRARLLPRMSVSELMATCSDFLRHERPSSSKVVQCACSKPPLHVVTTAGYQKWPLPLVTSDPSLGCSVNTILSGSRTLTQTRILGQCKCKCALTVVWLKGQGTGIVAPPKDYRTTCPILCAIVLMWNSIGCAGWALAGIKLDINILLAGNHSMATDPSQKPYELIIQILQISFLLQFRM